MSDLKLVSTKGAKSGDWKAVRLGDVVSHLQDVERNPQEAGLERFLKVEHFDTERLKIDRWGDIVSEDLPPTFYKLFKAGQVLYPTRNPHLRRTAVADFDGICGEKTLTLKAKSGIDTELLPYVFQTEAFIDYATSMSIGSTNPHVRWRDIAAYRFQLPDLKTQSRFAEVLIAADTVIDTYAQARCKCEQALSTIRSRLYSEAAELHESVSLGDVGEWRSGGTPSKEKKEYWGGDFPWVSPKDMKTDVINDAIDHITNAAIADRVTIVPRDSILIVVRGLILAHSFPIAMTGRELTFNQDMRALVPSDQYLPLFLFHWFHWRKPRLLNLVTETSHGTKRLPTDVLQNVAVPRPRLDVQRNVVELLEGLRTHVIGLQDHADTCRTLKRSVLNSLFRNSPS
ncbi:restriction endonuclease subunit S [Aureliella helgolandensis]|uniref:Type I restriction modification DNA specificity domain protein n=1 Tax=Aureliella helgolandensis TaxID=2527968 RepID=A0A518GFK3_9BACT|nr:restriction endonuclease subunit S [Aureliella helgolandensis]QDV27369.1 Type I restriction modification DNA specificity domain protein [Aureliella helgolandensis]